MSCCKYYVDNNLYNVSDLLECNFSEILPYHMYMTVTHTVTLPLQRKPFCFSYKLSGDTCITRDKSSRAKTYVALNKC
jgi:hypothetical protein